MPANTDHPSFRQPLRIEAELWRYMDLSKFCALIQQQALYFSRLDQLGDPFEGTITQLDGSLAERIIRTRNEGGQDWLPNVGDEQVYEVLSELRGLRRRTRKSLFASCWHMNPGESAAMWRLYSQSSDAVCIQTSYKTLADLLPGSAFVGCVKYIDYDFGTVLDGGLLGPAMCKRMSFSHENEVRAIVQDDLYLDSGDENLLPPVGKQIPCDVHELIEKIYVSPGSPDWFRSVVVNLCQAYKVHAPIELSRIGEDPIY